MKSVSIILASIVSLSVAVAADLTTSQYIELSGERADGISNGVVKSSYSALIYTTGAPITGTTDQVVNQARAQNIVDAETDYISLLQNNGLESTNTDAFIDSTMLTVMTDTNQATADAGRNDFIRINYCRDVIRQLGGNPTGCTAATNSVSTNTVNLLGANRLSFDPSLVTVEHIRQIETGEKP